MSFLLLASSAPACLRPWCPMKRPANLGLRDTLCGASRNGGGGRCGAGSCRNLPRFATARCGAPAPPPRASGVARAARVGQHRGVRGGAEPPAPPAPPRPPHRAATAGEEKGDDMRTDDVERRVSGWCALCRSRCGCISVVRTAGSSPSSGTPTIPPGARSVRRDSPPPTSSTAPIGCCILSSAPGPRATPTPLGPHRLGRGAGPRGLEAAAHRGGGRAGGGGVRDHDAERDLHLRLPSLARAAHARVREPEQRLRYRDLQLAQGPRHPLHLRRRDRDPGPRLRRLRAPLGPQPDRRLARAGAAR